MLEDLVAHSVEQGLTPGTLEVDELFAPSTVYL